MVINESMGLKESMASMNQWPQRINGLNEAMASVSQWQQGSKRASVQQWHCHGAEYMHGAQ